jgi:hypothetical protein
MEVKLLVLNYGIKRMACIIGERGVSKYLNSPIGFFNFTYFGTGATIEIKLERSKGASNKVGLCLKCPFYFGEDLLWLVSI